MPLRQIIRRSDYSWSVKNYGDYFCQFREKSRARVKTAFQCTHTMGGLEPSLHRESTDSLIHILSRYMYAHICTLYVS